MGLLLQQGGMDVAANDAIDLLGLGMFSLGTVEGLRESTAAATFQDQSTGAGLRQLQSPVQSLHCRYQAQPDLLYAAELQPVEAELIAVGYQQSASIK